MNYIGILFDLDGTLVNTLPDIAGVINLVRLHFRLAPLSETEVKRYIGKGVERLVNGTFSEIPHVGFQTILEKVLKTYVKHPHMGGQIYPGVRETLEKLRMLPRIRLGVITNKPTLAAHQTLNYYLPNFRFDVVAGPEKVSQKKPDSRHILEILPILGLIPENTWFVGDDPVDLQCAEKSGVHFLAATYGYGGVVANAQQRLRCFADLLRKIPLD